MNIRQAECAHTILNPNDSSIANGNARDLVFYLDRARTVGHFIMNILVIFLKLKLGLEFILISNDQRGQTIAKKWIQNRP